MSSHILDRDFIAAPVRAGIRDIQARLDQVGTEWTGPVPAAVRKHLTTLPTCPVCGIACRDLKAAEACCQPPTATGATFDRVLELRCNGLVANEIARELGTSFPAIVAVVRAVDDALAAKYGFSQYFLEKWRHERRAENTRKSP